MSEAGEMFEKMLEKIGLEKALELQMSVALKFQQSVKEVKDAVLTPQECAFMSVWIDSLVEMRIGELVDTKDEPNDPFQVGRPGGYFGYL